MRRLEALGPPIGGRERAVVDEHAAAAQHDGDVVRIDALAAHDVTGGIELGAADVPAGVVTAGGVVEVGVAVPETGQLVLGERIADGERGRARVERVAAGQELVQRAERVAIRIGTGVAAVQGIEAVGRLVCVG